MKVSSDTPKRKREYSNAYRSLEEIWLVLRQYSSASHPLTVKEICQHLNVYPDRPSDHTVQRLFPQCSRLMDLLFSGELTASSQESASDAYLDRKGLHLILKTKDGSILSELPIDSECSDPDTAAAPSYSNVDKLLKSGVLFELNTFPYTLRCVAQVKDHYGKVSLIPYDEWLDSLPDGSTNNMPRRYYLSSPLSDGEWRIFTDLVKVYPYLSPRQTDRFLSVLHRLHPENTPNIPSRYAFKQGTPQQFEIIDLLDRAIAEKRMVSLSYGERTLVLENGRWVPQLKARESMEQMEVAPYALLWSNGYYYLAAKHRGMMNLRTDRILSAALLNDTFTLPPDFDPAEYRDSCPVMYPGEKVFVHLRCKTSMINILVDFFGGKPNFSAPHEGFIDLTMTIAPAGVKLFALQYADSVEVIEPIALRDEITASLSAALSKYTSSNQEVSSCE